MSQASPLHLSHEATAVSEDDEFEAANTHVSGATPSSEAEQASTEDVEELEELEERISRLEEREGISQQNILVRDENTHQKRRRGRPRSVADQGYRGLLNSVIDDASGQSSDGTQPLPPSLVGASYWTSDEKRAFFTALPRHGVGDLQTLSRAVGTKSETEIHVYLALLQEGAVEVIATLPSHGRSKSEEIPSAVEIGADCEAALALAAADLARKLERRDIDAAKEEFGDDFLIDEAYAAKVERQIARSENEASVGDHAQTSPETPLQADDLLRPDGFLQLSRSLFMNGTAVSEHTWHDLVALPGSLGTEPAIFRSAFDGFHNLALSLTRRLVQATLFQTMSRLRANDASRPNWRPKPEVQDIDVRTALDVLDMHVDYKACWTGLPRRCGVDVYSESTKYRDGRQSTKNGVKLTYEEAEAELRVGGVDEPANTYERADGDSLGEGLLESDFDSDAFTLASDREQDEDVATDKRSQSPGADSDGIGVDVQSVRTKSEQGSDLEAASEGAQEDDGGSFSDEKDAAEVSLKRKRPLSPASFARAEELQLEALDRQASIEEQRRLWEILRQEPPGQQGVDSAATVPAPTCANVETDEQSPWRSKLHYEAMWERIPTGVAAEEFTDMDLHGLWGRKRRVVLQEKLLGLDAGSDGADDVSD